MESQNFVFFCCWIVEKQRCELMLPRAVPLFSQQKNTKHKIAFISCVYISVLHFMYEQKINETKIEYTYK